MPVFPSEEWLAVYREAVNASDEHREAAAGWEGDVTYVVEGEPDKGVPEDVYLWMDLHHGECREARIVSHDEGCRARFVILAPYSKWKEVIREGVDPIKEILHGRLRVRGDVPTIAKYPDAARELVRIAGSLQTTFPDES